MKHFRFILSLIGLISAAILTSAVLSSGFAMVLAATPEQYNLLQENIQIGMLSLSAGAGVFQMLTGSQQGKYAFTLITGTTLTFNGKEVREAIMKPIYKTPDIATMHKIVEGITTKTQVIYYGEIEEVTILDEGCDSEPLDNVLPFEEKYWQPKELEAWVQECYKNLKGLFLEWGLKAGYKRADLIAAQTGDDPASFWDEFILNLMMGAWKKDQFRISWFSDTASNTTGNGGYLTATGRIRHFNQGDGFWKKTFAAVAANQAYRYTITRNTNYADQSLLADDCLKALKAIHNNCDERIRDNKNGLAYRVTRSMYDNLSESYENKAPETGMIKLENGQETLKFRGIPVVEVSAWDRIIKNDFRDPASPSAASLFRPHRAALYHSENFQIGWSVGDNDVFTSWYNIDKKRVNMRGNVDFDTQIAHNELIGAAY
jgi:hypothetical protein